MPTEEEIFRQALSINDAQQRAAYLDEACAGDDALRSRVAERLATASAAEEITVVDQPADGPGNSATASAPPESIGPYEILQLLGEGGMGTVYAAVQRHPVRRQVAVKVIKRGMDSRQVISRFAAERQALALMNHPHIAAVIDAGTTVDGRPYFVMELVQGIPITKYCDAHRLTPAERLKLFIPVCQAIQHAHQKGVVHRDIKPSNVLVALYDGKPVPKVIDFGLAKALEPQFATDIDITQVGQLMGTLEYMSPEQAELTSVDVDTRTDVYSLGVLLYELLTGTTPLPRERLKREVLDRVLQLIREEQPSRPSTRLSEFGDRLPAVSADRRTDPVRLTQLFRGDVDCIVMKALEKERDRRYDSASGLADDIQRFLEHEPIVARPTSTAYRLAKLARKYRRAVVTAGLAALLLLVTSVAATWQALRAHRAEQRARRDNALVEAVNTFLQQDLLGLAEPAPEPDRDLELRTVLDRAAQRMGGRFANQPLVEADIRTTIGETYQSLGEYDEAERQLTRARQLHQQALGSEHATTLSTMNSIAELRRLQGLYDDAESLAQETLAARRRVLGAEHPHTLTTLHNLATIKQLQGDFEQAEALYQQVISAERDVLGEDHPSVLKTSHNLAQLYEQQGKYSEAEALMTATLQTRERVLGPEHLDTVASQGNLAALYQLQGKYADSERLMQQAAAVNRRVLGEEHPEFLKSQANLATLYYAQGRHADAEQVFRENLAVKKRALGDDHPDTLATLKNLAAIMHLQGKHDEAAPLLLQAWQGRKRVLGPEHPSTITSLVGVASIFQQQGKYAAAEEMYEEALEIQLRVLGDQHADTHVTRNNLAMLHLWQGSYDQAETLFQEALDAVRESLGPDHPHTLIGMYNLAEVYRSQQDFAQAEPIYRAALETQQRVLGAEHPHAMVTQHRLAALLLMQHNYEAAAELTQSLIDMYRRQQQSATPPRVTGFTQALNRLALCRSGQREFEQAEQLARESVTLLTARMPDGGWRSCESQSILGHMLARQGRFDEAQSLVVTAAEGLAEQQAMIPKTEQRRVVGAALQRVVDMYTAWEKPAEATRWQRKLDELP